MIKLITLILISMIFTGNVFATEDNNKFILGGNNNTPYNLSLIHI